MPDENQIEIPQTFIALFVERGRLLPGATQEVVIARYELCEDMACALVEHAQTMQFDQGLSEAEVLGRCHAALIADAAVITGKEAAWVICRLAELLSWPAPVLEPAGPDTRRPDPAVSSSRMKMTNSAPSTDKDERE